MLFRSVSDVAGAVEEIVAVLGLDDAEAAPEPELELPVAEIERLVRLREAARDESRFEEADRIREELEAAGVILEDGPDGTRWLRA